MKNGKAIEDFINACLETAREMGLQWSELGKLLEVLVETRADLCADSRLTRSSHPGPRVVFANQSFRISHSMTFYPGQGLGAPLPPFCLIGK